MKLIKRSEVKNIIQDQNGKIFSLVFTKKDGTDRHMVCRTGVSKGVNGKGLAFDPKSKGLLVVYDVQKDAHRMINLSTVKSLQVQKEILTVMND